MCQVAQYSLVSNECSSNRAQPVTQSLVLGLSLAFAGREYVGVW